MTRWSPEHLDLLRRRHAEGVSDGRIADELNRTAVESGNAWPRRTGAAVCSKRHQLGLCKRQLASAQKGRQGEKSAVYTGAVIEGRPADEALRSRCRQLAREIAGPDRKGNGSSMWHLKHEHGYTDAALAALLEGGRRWFEVTPMGVTLTELARVELLGGRAA